MWLFRCFVDPVQLRGFGYLVGPSILCRLCVTARLTGSRYPVIGLLVIALNPQW
jgi:hypothetical protein